MYYGLNGEPYQGWVPASTKRNPWEQIHILRTPFFGGVRGFMQAAQSDLGEKATILKDRSNHPSTSLRDYLLLAGST